MNKVYPYTPRKTDSNLLEDFFVGRHQLLDELTESLRNQGDAASLQHWMIVGQRGLGKSHLSTLLYYRIKKDEILRKQWVPILMDEEEPEVFSLATLFIRVLTVLAEELQDDDSEKSKECSAFLDRLRAKALPPERLLAEITAYLKDFTSISKQRLVVFLENTDDLLTNSLTGAEIKQFRNLLQNENFALFVATSPTFFEGIDNQKAPLYGLFRLRRLELLDYEASMELMRRWAGAAQDQEMLKHLNTPNYRFRVLYHLTGGNPRLLLFLYLTLKGVQGLADAVETVSQLLEHDLTGYYQSRMRDVPDQQKPIIMALARSSLNLTQKEIAERSFIPQKSMGTHINRLEKAGLVRAITDKAGKNTLYGLTDTLFRLWHQWRTGWRGQEVVQGLIQFLAIWYRESELADFAKKDGLTGQYSKLALEYRHGQEYPIILNQCLEKGRADISMFIEQDQPEKANQYIESYRDLGLDPTVLMDGTSKHYKGLKVLQESLLMNETSGEDDSSLPILKHAGEPHKPAKTQAELQRAVKTEPDNPQVYLDWALFLIKAGNLSQAKEILDTALRLDSQNPNIWLVLGAVHVLQEDYSEAEQAFVKSSVLGYEKAPIWSSLGAVRIMQNNYSGAEQAFANSVELDPEDADAWLNLGKSRAYQRNHAGAEKAFASSVELAPGDADAWLNLGAVRATQNNYSGAEQALAKTVELAPANAKGWFLLGLSRSIQSNYPGAEQAFSKTVELTPEDANAWLSLGLSRVEQTNYSGAEQAFSKTVELTPENANAWLILGLSRSKQGSHSGAEQAFSKTVELTPENANAWLSLGLSRVEQTNYSSAEQAFSKTVELTPEDADAWFYLGLSRSMQNNYASAEQAFAKSREIDPESPLNWQEHGFTCIKLLKFNNAYISLKRAYECDTSDTEVWSLLCQLHVLSGGRPNTSEFFLKQLTRRTIGKELRAELYLLHALILASEDEASGMAREIRLGAKHLNGLRDNADASEKVQEAETLLKDTLLELILPPTWDVVLEYLYGLQRCAPRLHAVLGRLEHVVSYFRELEKGPRVEATAKAKRVLDRIPLEEREPLEDMIKEVAKNIKQWRKAAKEKNRRKTKA